MDELLWVFDAVSFYPSAMWDEKNKDPRIETSYAFSIDMNDELIQKINSGTFTQRKAKLKIK